MQGDDGWTEGAGPSAHSRYDVTPLRVRSGLSLEGSSSSCVFVCLFFTVLRRDPPAGAGGGGGRV